MHGISFSFMILSMKILLLIFIFSLPAFAEREACSALIEELKITPQQGEATMRRTTLKGKTDDGKECIVRFMPDYCSFQLEAPLEKPEMYYLMETSISSIGIKFRRGEKFYLKTTTKEEKGASLGVLTKTLNLEKSDSVYELKYKIQDGRFIKTTVKSFECVVSPDLGPK